MIERPTRSGRSGLASERGSSREFGGRQVDYLGQVRCFPAIQGICLRRQGSGGRSRGRRLIGTDGVRCRVDWSGSMRPRRESDCPARTPGSPVPGVPARDCASRPDRWAARGRASERVRNKNYAATVRGCAEPRRGAPTAARQHGPMVGHRYRAVPPCRVRIAPSHPAPPARGSWRSPRIRMTSSAGSRIAARPPAVAGGKKPKQIKGPEVPATSGSSRALAILVRFVMLRRLPRSPRWRPADL